MASVPYWASAGIEATAWDVTWLGPHYLPGRTRWKVKKGRDIDVKKTPGTDGAIETDKGIDPATGEIDFHVYDNPDAWAAWCQILKQIDPHRPGAMREPLAALNPEPNHLGISQVIITDIESESPTCKGGKDYKIKWLQHFPQVKKTNAKTKAAQKGTETVPEILVPTINMNGVPNWVEKDRTVKNWIDKDAETGMLPDLPPFGSNALP
jgi:hypothetical protein